MWVSLAVHCVLPPHHHPTSNLVICNGKNSQHCQEIRKHKLRLAQHQMVQAVSYCAMLQVTWPTTASDPQLT